jgi:hypothetical protein
VITIEIQLLIDRLEALLVESRQVPFSSNVIIDRDRCFDIINQMRVSIPEEIKKAKRVQQERDRIIAHANEEAERIIALAREQATNQITDHEIIQQAERRAQIIVERAQHEVEEIRYGADDYALSVLRDLEQRLSEQLMTVRNGITTLQPSARETRAVPE